MDPGCDRRADAAGARFDHMMAYDEARQRVVVFGGRDSWATDYSSETWEWDGTTWLLRIAASAVEPRGAGAAAYESYRRLFDSLAQ